ncbi:MAG: CRISPR-associated endonuclease Cas1 [Deltaproteobacteria bacterium]|nr:MAG: CRISPR-associated endonuclease Cas1 [Deltaproteobacteria bacterium]
MQIVINSYGGFIRKRGECFEFGVGDQKQEVSARKVQSVLITTSVLVSSDAILLASENNVDIVFLDQYGNPFSRVWHSKFGSTAYIRRKQIELSENVAGVELVRDWISEKIGNQVGLLEKLGNTRKNKGEEIMSYAASMTENREKLERIRGNAVDEVRDKIFSLEAGAGKTYWRAVNFIMPEQYKFQGRSQHPARDEFNAFLNYGYGIMYSKVERACIIAGLDPYIGFLHTDNYGKRSFVYDVIELFRIYVDEVVIRLFSKRMVKKGMVREIKNGMMLDKDGKQLLVSEFNKEMEKSVRYRGRNVKKANIMESECHRIANGFIGRDKSVDMGGV